MIGLDVGCGIYKSHPVVDGAVRVDVQRSGLRIDVWRVGSKIDVIDGRVTGHVDVSELHRKYRFMGLYGFCSRVFDACLLCVTHPLVAIERFKWKVNL